MKAFEKKSRFSSFYATTVESTASTKRFFSAGCSLSIYCCCCFFRLLSRCFRPGQKSEWKINVTVIHAQLGNKVRLIRRSFIGKSIRPIPPPFDCNLVMRLDLEPQSTNHRLSVFERAFAFENVSAHFIQFSRANRIRSQFQCHWQKLFLSSADASRILHRIYVSVCMFAGDASMAFRYERVLSGISHEI